jgi:Tol biopolymer transport system component
MVIEEKGRMKVPRAGAFAILFSIFLAACGASPAGSNASPAARQAGASAKTSGTIVFVNDRDGNPNNTDYDQSIYLMNPDGTGLRQLIHGSWVDSPTWSPDGRSIAFAKQSGSQSDIYAINSDGSHLTRLTTDGADFAPAWSPAGDQIAFLKDEGDAGTSIYVMKTDGSQPGWVAATRGKALRVTWLVTGKKIAFENAENGTTSIEVVSAQTSGVNSGVAVAVGETPAFSPDGKWLAFVKDYALHVSMSDGTDQRRLSGSGQRYYWPSWAPDGQSLAVDGDATGVIQIYVIRVDGTGERQLTKLAGANLAPAWTASNS